MLNYLAKFIVGHCPLEEETKVTDAVIADTAEIKAWQEAVLSCQTASQLAVCMNLLDKKIIAWEKSTTKVFCSECRRGDNETLVMVVTREDIPTVVQKVSLLSVEGISNMIFE